MTPPGLAWLQAFCASTGMALDQGMTSQVYNTVNRLVYKVAVTWSEPVPNNDALQVWNLFQKWATVNSSTPSGRVNFDHALHPVRNEVLARGFSVEVHLKERLGHPKDSSPLS
jgi:hypothetical protein